MANIYIDTYVIILSVNANVNNNFRDVGEAVGRVCKAAGW